MTGMQWLKLLEKQSHYFNKPAFTTTELASLSGLFSRQSLLVQLCRLVKKGVLVRYRHGLYGISQYPAEQIVSYLDSSAYCTGHYALFKHGLTPQAPSTVTCFTNRHHCRNRIISAGPNTFEFVKPSPCVYSRPHEGNLATPEQALCDFVYYCRNRGLSFTSIIALRKLSTLNKKEIETRLSHYPKTVQREIVQSGGDY